VGDLCVTNLFAGPAGGRTGAGSRHRLTASSGRSNCLHQGIGPSIPVFVCCPLTFFKTVFPTGSHQIRMGISGTGIVLKGQ